ncbi:hypothetical protein CEUSTIGMA_g5076.t1 [Chlamydomonas eustigma]|uniref:Calcineurin-like phosphoesterase domain-containing protein n=1 Tax=Chlamydomonas eustigma TaxID=1157962 RepID=A0A250X3H7_9CHLO|nr:hypothetical protein CEUSTIGMA_g5076.t1 [Chlamydomonas eustigma]|eukprot:GAX77633.1 hypothetical protein CEUSTIGMA_g5076.t1 [Chlamydomonas eustigma]
MLIVPSNRGIFKMWFPFMMTEKEKKHQAFCKQQFPPLFESWVKSFSDFGFNGSPAAPDQVNCEVLMPTHVPSAERLIAIGDLHGDFRKAFRAFKLSGLIDDHGRWCGGSSVCVQVGDILDRGDQEIQIFYFLERLQREAEQAGGKLYVLNGNHETMNVASNHRYASPGAAQELKQWQQWQALGVQLRNRYGGREENGVADRSAPSPAAPATPSSTAGNTAGSLFSSTTHFERTAAMQPGAYLTRRFMACHPTVLQVGSSLFVHGGVLPAHVEYGLERINRETQSWMLRGSAMKSPSFLRGSTAIVWARDFSAEEESHCDCIKLKQVLESIPGAKRMVVGHTIQAKGVNTACDGKVVRVDVGLSRGCGDGEPQVLEILGDGGMRRLRERGPSEVLNQPSVSGGSSKEAAALGGRGLSGSLGGDQTVWTSSWEALRGRLNQFLGGPSQAA